MSQLCTVLEPASDFDATAEATCDWDFCEGYRAALALHSECPICHGGAFFDTVLQYVVVAWNRLSEPIRRAVLGIVESQNI